MRQRKGFRAFLVLVKLVPILLCLTTAPLLDGAKTYAQGQSNFEVYLPVLIKPPVSYLVQTVGNERRFFCDGHHFMTLIDSNGTFNLRPHPGVDVNGWGSSWYAQPFLPGAILQHSIIERVEAIYGEGIHVVASGQVSRGLTDTYGSWSMTLVLECNRAAKKITGTGEYSIDLTDHLSSATGDLNLFKIASNYLDDVPLLSGGIGDTGDMKWAEVMKGANEEDFWFSPWIPPDRPSFFPADETDQLSINVIGQCNNVDTAAQGYAPIALAYKPSLKVGLISQPNVRMRFGGIYDLAKSKDFWEDNVGITPLVFRTSTETSFYFDVVFESTALPGDGQANCSNG